MRVETLIGYKLMTCCTLIFAVCMVRPMIICLAITGITIFCKQAFKWLALICVTLGSGRIATISVANVFIHLSSHIVLLYLQYKISSFLWREICMKLTQI